MIKRCRTCGKIVDVLWPDKWAYYGKTISGCRREFFCSWKCLRKEEEKKAMAKRGRPAKKPAEDKEESVGTPAPKDGGEWEKAEDHTQDGLRIMEQKRAQQVMAGPKQFVALVCDPQIAEEYQKEQEDKEILERMKQDIEKGKRISLQEPLEVAAVYSKAMDGYQYRKTKDGMVLCGVSNNPLDMHTTTMILDWDEWKAFSAEIQQALKQLGDHE